MELLLGLAIATVVAIGWFYGRIFFAVFLTLPMLMMLLFITQSFSQNPGGGAVCLLIIAAIWAPVYIRHHLAKARSAGYAAEAADAAFASPAHDQPVRLYLREPSTGPGQPPRRAPH